MLALESLTTNVLFYKAANNQEVCLQVKCPSVVTQQRCYSQICYVIDYIIVCATHSKSISMKK